MARRWLIVGAWVVVGLAAVVSFVAWNRITHTDAAPAWATAAVVAGPLVALGASMQRAEC